MTERNETAQPAPLGHVERGVGRPVPERDHVAAALHDAHRQNSEDIATGWQRLRGCYECAYGKVAGCWRCGSR